MDPEENPPINMTEIKLGVGGGGNFDRSESVVTQATTASPLLSTKA